MNQSEIRLSLSDLAAIELMRTDDGHARDCAGVDDRMDPVITKEFATNREGDQTATANPWMPRLIAERAKRYCEEVQGIAIERHLSSLRQWRRSVLKFAAAAVCVLGLFTAFAGPSLFFDADNHANISKLLALLVVMFAVSLISVAGLVVMLVQWFRDRSRGIGPKDRRAGLVMTCVWEVADGVRWLMNLICRRETGPSDDSLRYLKMVATRQSYFASALSLLTINAYMLLVTIAIWVALNFFLFTSNVNYSYPNSLKSPEERASMVAWFGRPVESLWTAAPDASAIAWAEGTFRFDESEFLRKGKDGNPFRISDDEVDAIKQNRFGGFRRQWSNFFVGCAIVWLVLPRIVVCGICAVCAWCFRRDLLPDAEDQNVKKIVMQVLNAGRVTGTETSRKPELPSPPDEPTQPTPVPPPPDPVPVDEATSPSKSIDRGGGFAASSTTSRPKRSEPKRPAHPKSEIQVSASVPVELPKPKPSPTPLPKSVPASVAVPRARKTRLIGYELDDDAFKRLVKLSQKMKATQVDANINGAREQRAYVDELASDNGCENHVVLVASLLGTADDSLREFLQYIANSAGVQVLLTEGTAARKEYGGVGQAFDRSVQEWRKMIRHAGVADKDILEHDLGNATGISKAVAALGGSESSEATGAGVTLAGRHPGAIRMIGERTRLNQPGGDAIRDLDRDLSKLYAAEKRGFAERLKGIKSKADIQSQLSEINLPKGFPTDGVSLARELFASTLNKLSTRWIVSGALASAAVGGTLAMATGGLAALPMLVPIIVGNAAAGGIAGGFAGRFMQSTGQTSPETADESDDLTVARFGILQTLLYELQGNAEADVSHVIGEVTRELDQRDYESSDSMLHAFANLMEQQGESR